MNEKTSSSRVVTLRWVAEWATIAHEYQSAVEICSLAVELARSPLTSARDNNDKYLLPDGRAKAYRELGNFDQEAANLDAIY